MRVVTFHLFLLSVFPVNGDIYMNGLRGSNNRLNGEGRERRNANRLFDSQNNNRGGYNVGGTGNVEGAASMTYIGGSLLKIQWTNQHECGKENTGCDIIIQYMCEDSIRDGTITATIQEDTDLDDSARGRHETQDYYAECKARRRDTRLYRADQNLRGLSAIYTRQNPGGTRRGLECPEERDYFPYHHPTQWKDIVIFTSKFDKCEHYKNESQNVKSKGYCKFATKELRDQAADYRNGDQQAAQRKAPLFAPITPTECNNKANMQWVEVPAHGIPKPECKPAPVSRDNHLGNTESPDTNGPDEGIPKANSYVWTIPDINAKACVLRIRYNITNGDQVTYPASDENEVPTVDVGSTFGLGGQAASQRGYIMKNNPRIKPFLDINLDFALAINTAQTGRTFQDRSHKFSITKRNNTNTPQCKNIINLGVIGKRGNIVQVFPAVEYGFEPDVVNVTKGDCIHFQWTGSLKNPNNNDGEGRNKEDKSNIISLDNRRYNQTDQPDDTTGHPGNSYPLNIETGRVLGVSKDVAQELAFPRIVGSVQLPVGGAPVTAIKATASSVLNNQLNQYGPNFGIAGGASTGRYFFHSKRETDPWYRLTLKPAMLKSLTIVNRKDCCGERLKNVEVRAGNTAVTGNTNANPVVGRFIGPGITNVEHVIPFSNGPVSANNIEIKMKTTEYLQINGIKFNDDGVQIAHAGCFSDQRSTRVIQDENVIKFDARSAIQRCAERAKQAGNDVFGLRSVRRYQPAECYTDKSATAANAAQTYARYGKTTGCFQGKGANGRMDVYLIGASAAAAESAAATAAVAAAAAAATLAATACNGKPEDRSNCATNYGRTVGHTRYYCTNSWWVKKYCCRFCASNGYQRDAPDSDADDVEEAMPEMELSFDDVVADIESKLDDSEEEVTALEVAFDEEVLVEKVKRGGNQQGGDASKLDYAPAHVSFLPEPATTCGTYYYLSTRNNNFSNRSQKGKIIVEGCSEDG